MRMTLKDFFELDESKKDAVWGNKIVTHLRAYMQPLIKNHDYWYSMRLLLGGDVNDMVAVRKLFKDPDASGASFKPIAVMEKIRNVIIAENENAGININLKASDPTAINQKQKDRELMANRKVIESMMSFLQQGIGGPPFSLKNKTDGDGKKIFSGQVEDFDKMGLDDNSMEDLDYFFSTYYRLRHEIKAEEPVNFFVKYNELSEQIALYVNDILASKRISAKVYVNEVTGAIDYKYLCPANVNYLNGRRRDLNDATAKSYEEDVSVGDFIKLVGDEFDYKYDLELLLGAANNTNGTNFCGVLGGDSVEDGLFVGSLTGNGELCSYSEFLEMAVRVGYIEWKSTNGTAQRVTMKNYMGNPSILPATLDRKMTANSIYKLDTRFYEMTYKAYYLVLGTTAQKIYKYGPLSYQEIEGAEDEYSSFSIVTYREKGKSAVRIAEPYILMVWKAWAKFEHMVAAAKPTGRAYNYDSLLNIAKNMFPQLDTAVGIDSVLKMFFDGTNEIYTNPTTEDGKPIGGGGMSSHEIPNGLQKSALDFKTVIDYADSKIDDVLGISRMRDGGNSDPREGYKQSMKGLEYSHNATQYIRGMVMNLLNNIAKRTLSYTQDIVRFRERNTLPYKFLITALGDETMNDMDTLFDTPLHRYGIFVEALNTQFEREEIKGMATSAMQNKEISYEQLLLITSVGSPKRAAMILAYEKKRKERNDAKIAQAQHDQQMQLQAQMDAAKQQMQKDKIAGEIERENVKGGYLVQVARINAGAEVDKQNLKNEAKPVEIDNRKQANIEEKTAASNLQAQQPMMT